MIGSFNPAATVNLKMQLGLRAVRGEFMGQEFPLVAARFVVGRGERSDLRLQSQRVSRMHCLFVRTEQNVVVSDLKSRNGTRVNGQTICATTKLKLGDLISVESCLLEFVAFPKPDTRPLKNWDEDDTAFLEFE